MENICGNCHALAGVDHIFLALHSERHFALQNIVEGISKILFLAEALSIRKSQKCHLAMLISGKGHADHSTRLNANHMRKALSVVKGKISQMVHWFTSL